MGFNLGFKGLRLQLTSGTVMKHCCLFFFCFFRLGPNQKEYVDRRGVHVVVGHYMGETSKSQNPPNLTDGETDL